MAITLNENEKDEILENLILSGAVEFYGIDSDTGEVMYTFSKDLENIDPSLYKAFLEDIEREVYFFWEKGFLHMDPTEANPSIRLMEKALDRDAIQNELTEEQRIRLELLKKIMMQ